MLNHRFIGDTYRAIVTLLTPRRLLYARELHDSVNGLGTDEHAISEILGSMNASEIADVSAIYLDGTERDDNYFPPPLVLINISV